MSPRTLLPSKYSYDSNLADVKFDSVFPSLCIETAIVTAGQSWSFPLSETNTGANSRLKMDGLPAKTIFSDFKLV